jgi:hypothetical protein
MATADLLAARRSLRGTQWDGVCLDHFVQLLCRLDAERHGFAVDDLQAIETAWVGEAGEAWSGGFVARLKDGRRAHADGRAGRSHWAEDGDVDAGLLDAGDQHPELSARHGWQGHAWDENVARTLNELLSRLTPVRRQEAG